MLPFPWDAFGACLATQNWCSIDGQEGLSGAQFSRQLLLDPSHLGERDEMLLRSMLCGGGGGEGRGGLVFLWESQRIRMLNADFVVVRTMNAICLGTAPLPSCEGTP